MCPKDFYLDQRTEVVRWPPQPLKTCGPWPHNYWYFHTSYAYGGAPNINDVCQNTLAGPLHGKGVEAQTYYVWSRNKWPAYGSATPETVFDHDSDVAVGWQPYCGGLNEWGYDDSTIPFYGPSDPNGQYHQGQCFGERLQRDEPFLLPTVVDQGVVREMLPTEDGSGDYYYRWLSPNTMGANTIFFKQRTWVDILLVGGGGAGGAYGGGGGGGGGIVHIRQRIFESGLYDVQVGAGSKFGLHCVAYCDTQVVRWGHRFKLSNGEDLVAKQGGNGGSEWYGNDGKNGGCGGGTRFTGTGTGYGQPGTSVQGNTLVQPGSEYTPGVETTEFVKGGANGAQIGFNNIAAPHGSGGGGLGGLQDNSHYNGMHGYYTTIRGVGEYYAGGGAGGTYSFGPTHRGGFGGGANSAASDTEVGSGIVGGGGAGGRDFADHGGNGGDGVVIIRVTMGSQPPAGALQFWTYSGLCIEHLFMDSMKPVTGTSIARGPFVQISWQRAVALHSYTVRWSNSLYGAPGSWALLGANGFNVDNRGPWYTVDEYVSPAMCNNGGQNLGTTFSPIPDYTKVINTRVAYNTYRFVIRRHSADINVDIAELELVGAACSRYVFA